MNSLNLLQKASSLLLVFCSVFLFNGCQGDPYNDGSTYLYEVDGERWDLVSSKWYNGMREDVKLNMAALVIEGDSGFSLGDNKKVQWIAKEVTGGNLDPDKYCGKILGFHGRPASTMNVRMKTWSLKTLENGEKEEPYPIVDFDMDYSYYLSSGLRVEDDGLTVTLKVEATGAYMMFAKGKKVKKGDHI